MSGDMQMEKSRTCPSCRCSISVLATKCRFCGETVGKPKVEVRQLSVDDLGGESTTHQAVSSSVLEALDAMRQETGTGGEDESSSDASGMVGGAGIDTSGLDDFDQPSFRAHTTKLRKPTVVDRLMTVVKIAAVIGVVAIIAIKVPPMFKSNSSKVNEIEFTPGPNLAPQILEENGDLLGALKAAVNAKKENSNAENDKIADDVVVRIEEDVESFLNASPWTMDDLNAASTMADSSARIFPSDATNALKMSVEQEYADYHMLLVDIDVDAKTAEFQLSDRKKAEVKIGELVAGRFKVVDIQSNAVYLKDTKRDGRSLMCAMAQGPR